MTWTYTGPASGTKDQVRFVIGDTDSARPLLTDEEIAFCLTQASDSVNAAAVSCAKAILAKYAARPSSESVGDVSFSWSTLRENLLSLISQLLSDLPVAAYAGPNIDRDPAFTRETHFADSSVAFPEETVAD